MKHLMLLFALTLAVTACGSSPWDRSPSYYYTTPSCNIEDYAIANAVYRDQVSGMWDLMRDRLYTETLQPRTGIDAMKVARYEQRLRDLDRELTVKYGAAVTSCEKYQACARGGYSSNDYTCEDLQGDMLQDKTAFMRLGGALDDMKSEVLSYEPVPDATWEHDPRRGYGYGDKYKGKRLKEDDTCTNVDSVFTVGCDTEDDRYDKDRYPRSYGE